MLWVKSVTVALPLLAFSVLIALLVRISWPALIGGVALCFWPLTLLFGLLPLVFWLRPSLLDNPKLKTMLPPICGVLIELARLGLVRLLDADLGEAVWLGFGEKLAGVFIGFAPAGLLLLGRPPRFDQDQAAAGRSHASSYARSLLWVGDLLACIGFSLLTAYSPWLALVTVPVCVALAPTGKKDGLAGLRVELATLLVGIVATVAGLALFGALG